MSLWQNLKQKLSENNLALQIVGDKLMGPFNPTCHG